MAENCSGQSKFSYPVKFATLIKIYRAEKSLKYSSNLQKKVSVNLNAWCINLKTLTFFIIWWGGEALDLWGCETLSCCQKKPPAFNIIFVNFATNYWWDWKKENPGVGFLGIWKENTVIACRPNHQRGKFQEELL